ncbi:MAG TPA: hypothetical protein VKY15_02400, partial [Acidimicrobiales bacterium]|nr:hypothetical protein [Acidimicrobiales bacterium]
MAPALAAARWAEVFLALVPAFLGAAFLGVTFLTAFLGAAFLGAAFLAGPATPAGRRAGPAADPAPGTRSAERRPASNAASVTRPISCTASSMTDLLRE